MKPPLVAAAWSAGGSDRRATASTIVTTELRAALLRPCRSAGSALRSTSAGGEVSPTQSMKAAGSLQQHFTTRPHQVTHL